MGLLPTFGDGERTHENVVEFQIRAVQVSPEPVRASAPAPVEVVRAAPVRRRAPVHHALPPLPSGVTPSTGGMECPVVATPSPAPIVATPPETSEPKGLVGGSGTGGVDAEEMMPAYLRAVHQRLVRRLVVPARAEREGREGTVLLRILIRRDGSLESATVVGGGTDPVLRGAALQAIRDTAPLPPPPPLPGAASIAIRVPVRFTLR
jgi:TonB family protein